MENSPALEERVTKLEYYVFEQLPPKMAAMDFAATQIHALTQANGEAIAGLRVDMAAMESRLHADTVGLKAALNLQGDEFRKQFGTLRAEVLTSITALRDRTDQRFERVDGQVSVLRDDLGTVKEDVGFLRSEVGTLEADVTTLKADVTTLKADVTTLKADVGRRFDSLDGKVDALIAEIRSGRN